MPQKQDRIMLGFGLAACLALTVLPGRAAQTTACPGCAEWNIPQPPFRIFGNSYYVGTRGLSAILVTSNEGHVLLDGGLPESAPLILANIRALGFRIEDVKLIVNSHVHFDHAGGIAELQRLSGAGIAASAWTAKVMREGAVAPDDPQFAIGLAIAPVAQVKTIADGETLRVGPIALTAHLTPGHTPGGTSWSWQSCDGGKCLNLVYADSLTAVSREGFRFTASREYPRALSDFEKSFATISALPCDVLLAPHPGFSDIFGKLARREQGAASDPFIDPEACRKYVNRARADFERRVAREKANQP